MPCIQVTENSRDGKLPQSFRVRGCLRHVRSPPIHCAATGCTTIGQLEDDVRIAIGFRPMEVAEMERRQQLGKPLHGPETDGRARRTDQRADGGNG